MKKLFKLLFLLLILPILFTSCEFFNDVKFGEIEVGENFWSSRDGHYKKLPHNYCLNIVLRSKAYLFRVPIEYNNTEWDSSLCYDNIIIEGHFIKGFFDSEYLVLCEEQEKGNLIYIVFGFSDEQIQYYHALDDVYDLLNLYSFRWFDICNTNEEIESIK